MQGRRSAQVRTLIEIMMHDFMIEILWRQTKHVINEGQDGQDAYESVDSKKVEWLFLIWVIVMVY